MGKKTQRPHVMIKTYRQAERIFLGYNESEQYLRDIIRNHVLDGELVVDCSDYKNLLYHGRVIKGVAEKILREHSVASKIVKNIRVLSKTMEPEKRGLLDERICIQLEACKAPGKSYLIGLYESARAGNN